jgi:hypothetical protein
MIAEKRLFQMGVAGSTLKANGVLNAGLLDQVNNLSEQFRALTDTDVCSLLQRAALRWVQRYIGRFGGDKR